MQHISANAYSISHGNDDAYCHGRGHGHSHGHKKTSLQTYSKYVLYVFLRIACRESTHPARGGASAATGTNSTRRKGNEKFQDVRAACTVQCTPLPGQPRRETSRRRAERRNWHGHGHSHSHDRQTSKMFQAISNDIFCMGMLSWSWSWSR